MDRPVSHRWLPAFILHRWVHLFWILPLLGFGFALVQHKDRLLIGEEVVGTVALFDSVSPVPGIGMSRPTVPPPGAPPSLDEFLTLEALSKAAEDAGLPALWHTSPSRAGTRLRSHVTWEQRASTTFYDLKVRGIPKKEAEAVCGRLMQQSLSRVAARSHFDLKGRLAYLEHNLERWIASGIPEHPGEEGLTSIEQVRQRIEELKQSIALAESKSPSWQFGLDVTSLPRLVKLDLEPRLKAFGFSAARYFGIGLLAAIVLAYLLELLFPRRRQEAVAV